jgi:glycerol-3-phosphate dehydrogenase (NAD(P)+)
VRTATSAHALAAKFGIEMPIVAAVHAMITSDINPRDAVNALMTRDPKEEDTI